MKPYSTIDQKGLMDSAIAHTAYKTLGLSL